MRRSRPTAMVCSPDPLMRSIFARSLNHAGYEVVAEVASASEVTALSRVVGPDVVIADLSLPGAAVGAAAGAAADLLAGSPQGRLVVCAGSDSGRVEAARAGATVVIDRSEVGSLPRVLAGLWRQWASQADSLTRPA